MHEQARLNYAAKSERLARLIQPLAEPIYGCDCRWTEFRSYLNRIGDDYGGIELCPDFQRGHVWSPSQQKHYLENVLRGVVPASALLVQFNCSNWSTDDLTGELPSGFQCIDGLQRITAVDAFLNGEVQPFGLAVEDLDGSRFSLRGPQFCFRVAVHAFQRRADLLDYYLALNAGGTPHSVTEIERVRRLLAAAVFEQGASPL